MSAADSYSQFLRRKLSVVPRTGIAGEIRADGSLFGAIEAEQAAVIEQANAVCPPVASDLITELERAA